ncbi:MAG: hypothetical protein E1N59_1562 [Puniceicoccaceae bacterium 5H]|nr:MAG: hypothetical protein E1N59_1562 [Puniceicoccaceae bacterium 5H]
MKLSLSQGICIAAWTAAAVLASAAQEYSEPIGALRVTLKGGSDTRVGLPLDRQPVYQGQVASISGSTLTLSGTPGWTNGQWVSGAPASGDTYQLLFMSGTEEGMALTITGNDADTVAVELGNETLAEVSTDAMDGTGDQVRIVPCATPQSLFSNAALPDQTILYLYDQDAPEINKAPKDILTYFDGYGWYTADYQEASYRPLERGTSFLVRLPKDSADVDLVLQGHVPMTVDRKRIPAVAGQPVDYPLSVSDPMGVSVGESGLGLTNQTVLYAYDETEAGFDPSPNKILTYYEGYGWYDTSFNLVSDSFMLEPGTGYVLRVPSAEQTADYVISRLPNYLQP